MAKTAAKRNEQPWQNRIVGSGSLRAGEFLANEANWRIHPMTQRQALAGTLSEIGWIQQVIVNKRTSDLWGRDQNVETLVDGHLRVSLALSRGEDEPVPVVYVDLTPDEERLALATIDPLSAMAATDREKLDELLSVVSTSDAGVQELLTALAEDQATAALTDDRRAKDMLGTLLKDGYDFQIDAAKLGYRMEAVLQCPRRERSLELFAGLGLLSYWYGRSFVELVRVDRSEDGTPDIVAKAEKWLATDFDPSTPFDFVDFDDEGCPNEALQVFFRRIKDAAWPAFVLSLTDGGGLNLKARGRLDLQKKYRYGETKGVRQSSTELYEAFPVLVEHHLTTIAAEAGYTAERINLHRGSRGNVVYASYNVKPN